MNEKNSNMNNELNKDLNELLPSNLLSEMDYNDEEEKTEESEDWNENVDVK